MKHNLDERIKLASVRKFSAQIIVRSEGEFLQINQANYAASTTQAVLMFLRDIGIRPEYDYNFRVVDIDGIVTYWQAEMDPFLDILLVQPCLNTVWQEACAGVSNTRTDQRYLDNLGTEDEWQSFRESQASGECD